VVNKDGHLREREAELNPTTATLHCLCGGNGQLADRQTELISIDQGEKGRTAGKL